MVTTVSLNFSRLLESQTSEKDIWINEQLMLSSDVTTRKPGSDFDWLIVQKLVVLNYILVGCPWRNLLSLIDWVEYQIQSKDFVRVELLNILSAYQTVVKLVFRVEKRNRELLAGAWLKT